MEETEGTSWPVTSLRTVATAAPTAPGRLRKLGWNISAAARKHRYDGIFVSAAGDYVSVYVDLGNADENAAAAEGIRKTVAIWGEAKSVTVRTSEEGTATVTFFYRKNG